VRAGLLALLVALNLALLATRRPVRPATLYPVPPALTRVAATGGRPLTAPAQASAPGASLGLAIAVLQRGPHPDAARAGRLAALPSTVEAHRARGLELRALLQRDAADLARILGGPRVAWAAAHRVELAAVGEDAAWEAAAEILPEQP